MTDTDLRAALERLHGLIKAELELIPDKPRAFDSGAAAAYNYVLSEWPDVAALDAPAAGGLDVERLIEAIRTTAPILDGTSHEYAAHLVVAAYNALREPSREPGEEG